MLPNEGPSNESPTIKFGALLRAGRSCEQVREELSNCDTDGFERARISYNATLGQLAGLLDQETSSELSVLCPPLEVGGPGVKLAYAALSGWISGLLAANSLSEAIAQISAMNSPTSEGPVGPVAATGTYL
jgi:hypothetical protein